MTVNGLTTNWLATRLGTQPAVIEARRGAGELVGVLREDGVHVYPSWQFGADGEPLAGVQRLVAAAREAGVDDERLDEVLTMRTGLTGTGTLCDAFRAGHTDAVIRAVRSARR